MIKFIARWLVDLKQAFNKEEYRRTHGPCRVCGKHSVRNGYPCMDCLRKRAEAA